MKRIVIGILAHVDAGKTTLSEAMLYQSGAIRRLGRVDRRDAFLDTHTVERQRGITVFSKQAVFSFSDSCYTLLDTPGHVDFSAEAERALQVLDYAILVISGTDGVQSHTATLWKLLKRYDVPCFIFVNKMDLAGTDRYLLMNELRGKLNDRCTDFGTEPEIIYENIALCDDGLFEEYDESGMIVDESICKAIAERKVFPVMFGSALKLEGTSEFLECLNRFTISPGYYDSFAAQVYKISADQQGSRLTFMKITGGSLKTKDVIDNERNINGEKVNQIRIYSGDKYSVADEALPGTVCAVTGLSFTRPGDALGAQKRSASPLLQPVLTYRVILPEGTDIHTALPKLRLLEAEDPALNVSLNERLGAIQLQLMGEIQLEVLKAVIEERFGFNVGFDEGAIIYKETITEEVEGVGHFEPLRHYAEVHLILRPAARGSGITIKSECREDALDKNWQRLILTHLYEKTHLGALTGSPVTDIEIVLAAGRAHPKHTEGGDFRQATYRAVRQGLRSAKSVLLEPVYRYTLTVPADQVGRAMADIGRMSGSFDPPEQNEDQAVITGLCPAATMNGYSREIMQYTHGKGKLSCTLQGYEPCHNADEVIAAIGYDADSDLENTADSIFCSHGAGHTVKWNDVQKHMHLSSLLGKARQTAAETNPRERVHAAYGSGRDIFASDRELMRIFEQTYGPVRRRESNSPQRRYVAPSQQAQNSKKKAHQPYDGVEYVLVDGYNVIHSWDFLRPKDNDSISIEGARNALINILCNYQGYRKCELILVFDAYTVKGDREVEQIDGISIVYTKEAETADMYIEKTSHKLAKTNRVRVVTSDRLEQLIIIGNGALRVSSEEFLEEVRNIEQEIREIISTDFKY